MSNANDAARQRCFVKAKQRRLTAKERAYVEAITAIGSDTFNNAYQSAIKAGYTEQTAKRASVQISENIRVKAAILDKQAEKREKYDWDEQIALGHLRDGISIAKRQEQPSAIASLVTTANRMFQMDQPTSKTQQERQRSADDQAVIDDLVAEYKRRYSIKAVS